MGVFNESFYTTDFDQQMMDFIKEISDYEVDNQGNWREYHSILAYGKGLDLFWTDNNRLDSYPSDALLTKQQFKEKIGMPMDKPATEKKTFTKKDLVGGMFVKTRNGEINIVIGDIACDNTGFLYLKEEYNEDMLDIVSDEGDDEYDIIEVFVKDSEQRLHEYLSGKGLKSIWKRTPTKSEKVIKLEKLIAMHEEQLEATKKLLAEELSL